MMKAQVTIEYLLLSMVALVLISFSIIALAKVKESSDKAFDAVLFRSSATELANAIGEACALGHGNSRTVYVKRRMAVEGGEKDGVLYAQFTDSETGLSLVRETFCGVEDNEVYGNTKAENEDGEITLEN